ncbi:NUDIX hydrolase domain-like protein [Cristinia sonorae]|uniref:NAD(+) diphosphatase n=1 Tax=Cristinia sonorae TaxID=1940300 RepID=A0A8K0UXY2_9AGAR|nr:NUDIX hydrolase domain-like protein [Cristinia sonorae]
MADSPVNPTNFFSGSPLNRLSWLRTSQVFLNAVADSSAARWILIKDGQPLVATNPPSGTEERGKKSLARLSTNEVRPLLGRTPLFSQGQNDGEFAPSDVHVLEAARLRGPPIVFLGLHEPNSDSEGADALPSSDFSAKVDAAAVAAKIKGTPYFTLDVSDVEQKEVDAVVQSSEGSQRGVALAFTDTRGVMYAFSYFDAAVTAEARSMVDWNARNKYCPGCTAPVFSAWAGWKLSCSSLLPWADNTDKKPCPTSKGLNNFSHPRTDAVVIMAVLNEANDKILLGRNKKWLGSFYSALAGFIEPGESLEDAVKRELWEEAGLKVWGIRYHSTQPWPFPANLMVGFYAIADPSLPTRIDLDNELEDARWFSREEIIAVLDHPEGTNLNPREPKAKAAPTTASALAGDANVAKETELKVMSAETPRADEPPFRLPPLTAIAGVLINDWARGKTNQLKGNL